MLFCVNKREVDIPNGGDSVVFCLLFSKRILLFFCFLFSKGIRFIVSSFLLRREECGSSILRECR